MTVRDEIVTWAKWGVAHHDQFTYSEGPQRMEAIRTAPGTLPVVADCSAFVTLCFKWAGAPDPNGLSYDGEGYTGTLLSHMEHIALEQVQPGDIIVYGPPPGWHTAVVVEAGPDPLTVSHGQAGDPNFCRVSADGRQPQTYLRGVPVDPAPAAPSPRPAPSLLPPGAAPALHLGSLGPQNWLAYLKHQLGFFPPYRGAFGPTLWLTLRKFQKSHGLPATGRTDPKTWEALQ